MKKFATSFGLLLSLILFAFSVVPAGAQQQQLTPQSIFDELSRQSGNNASQVRLITDNPEAWYARWYVISNAKKSIDVTYFIIERDVFGMSLMGLLLKKAQEGVKVRLMMDARGTKELTRTMLGQDYLQELIQFPNVEIHVYNPLNQRLIALVGNIRNLIGSNHDKIVIADGEWVICGGRNVSMNYFVDPKDEPTVYRDTDVILRGANAANQIKLAFDEEFNSHDNYKVTRDIFGNWVSRRTELELARRAMQSYLTGMGLPDFRTAGKSADALKKYTDELAKYKNLQSFAAYEPFHGERAYPTFILDKHSFRGTRNDITPALAAMIRNAKKEIIIQNPYVVLTPEALSALKDASARGVAINIHTNSPVSSDSLLTQAFFLEDWQKVLKELPTCRIFAFNGKRKLHSKTFVFDREITVVGTYNMDYVSEQINSEVVVAIKSRPFGERTALRVLTDERESVEYKIEKASDGTVKPAFGPESHSSPEKIRTLNILRQMGFLRPII